MGSIKVYIIHAGGMAVFQLGRLADLNHSMAPDARNKRPLMEYLPNFWFDLDVHAVGLRRGVLEVVGVDRLVHGTNFGGAYDHGDPTAGLGRSAEDKEDPQRQRDPSARPGQPVVGLLSGAWFLGEASGWPAGRRRIRNGPPAESADPLCRRKSVQPLPIIKAKRFLAMGEIPGRTHDARSEERRVGKEC